MPFKQNQLLELPELAARVGLISPEFRVDAILSGGMGECILVVQEENAFALKVIQKDLVEDPDAWERYLREVRLWTTLSPCDGVVEALCIVRVNEVPMVCSSWMQGGNLRRHLKNRSPDFFFSVMARIVGLGGHTIGTTSFTAILSRTTSSSTNQDWHLCRTGDLPVR